jgi:hypothetical protein
MILRFQSYSFSWRWCCSSSNPTSASPSMDPCIKKGNFQAERDSNPLFTPGQPMWTRINHLLQRRRRRHASWIGSRSPRPPRPLFTFSLNCHSWEGAPALRRWVGHPYWRVSTASHDRRDWSSMRNRTGCKQGGGARALARWGIGEGCTSAGGGGRGNLPSHAHMGQAQANITTSNIPIDMADRTKTNRFSFDLTGGMVYNFDKRWNLQKLKRSPFAFIIRYRYRSALYQKSTKYSLCQKLPCILGLANVKLYKLWLSL